MLNAYTIVFAALLIPAGKLADRVGHRKVVPGRLDAVHRRLDGVRPGADRRAADRVPHRPGRRCRRADPLVVGVGDARLRPRPAAPGRGDLGRGRCRRRGARTDTGRGDRRGARLAVGVLHQPPVGVYTVRRRAQEPARVVRPRDPGARPSSASSSSPAPPGCCPTAWSAPTEYGWLSARTLGVARRRRGRARACSSLHQQHTKAPALDLDLFRIANFRWAQHSPCWCSGPRSPRCSSARSCSSPTCGDGRCSRPASASPPGPVVRRRSSHPGWASSPAGSGSDRSSSPAALCYAASGLCARRSMLGPDVDYLRDYFPSMVLSGLGVACCFPQLSSVVAQALPASRIGVGGAALQAVRQFGGTFGVALTDRLPRARPASPAPSPRFDRIWWIVVAGGVVVTVLALPLRTGQRTAPAS